MTINQDLIQSIFKRTSLSDVSEETLNSLTEKYPYFAHIHWMNAIKKWSVSHDVSSLEGVGAYAFYPIYFQQYLDHFQMKNNTQNNIFPETDSKSMEAAPPGETDLDVQQKSVENSSLVFSTEKLQESVLPVPEEVILGETKSESDLSEEPNPEVNSFEEKENPIHEAMVDKELNEENSLIQNINDKTEEGDETGKSPELNSLPEYASLPSDETLEAPHEDKLPDANHESVPIVEPLFTQDYFAFTGETLPNQIENDKKPTMEQLQSFTGWLRTMKRSVVSTPDPDSQEGDIYHKNYPEEPTNGKPGENENIIHEEEVITESMAEVRVSRGETDKAIAIYEKLSLSNPEKSSYFAQKIEALKNR